SVLKPAALIFSAAGGQLLPQLVYFLLCLAVHEERYRRREFELWAAVQGVEVLTLELERARHDRPLRPRPGVSISRDAHHLRILEDRHVEIHRLFGLAVEPQERGNLLHWVSLGLRRQQVGQPVVARRYARLHAGLEN